LQPDLGTNLVFVMIAAGMLVCAGFPLRYIVGLTVVVVIGVYGILNSDTLEDYQRDRLTSFASEGDSYNTRQSQTAISLGGLTGSGYLGGEYTKGGSVPEQQTDFIFTVSGEEFGFVGSSVLLLLLAGIIWRIWRTAQLARDRVGMLICVGVLCMFMFHIFENVGMSLGIMPITGIPLPFVSYGGSAMVTAFIAIGLVLNVHMRRFH
ncbi:MAG: FtsW/RodA/SpoVE family cell cycle protein, partial [Actinobacteria bacterium]|nr:FtsW/RodA/SpoVE family cell cycle protein [Actinomycetota bacterium]